MKKRCIIHFGMHKTGSSSIQQSLFRAAPCLNNLHYLEVGSANLSGAIATAFGDHPTQYHANRKRGLTEAEVNARVQEIKLKLTIQLQEASKPSFLLSAEKISTLGRAGLLHLVDWLTGQIDDIQAVGYIRDPLSFMASAFQQYVKGGLSQLNWLTLVPRYQDRFEVFDQVLGRDRVQFWKFDPATFPNGCVVRDFCARLGIDLPEAQIIRANEGLSREAVALLYAYRKYGPGYGIGPTVMAENNRLIRVLAQLSGHKLQFAAKAVEPVLNMQREQIAWMEERLGASLKEAPADDPHAICEEVDLLNFSPDSVRWLKDQLEQNVTARWPSSPTPEMITQGMHVLRLKLTQEAQSASRINRQSKNHFQQFPSSSKDPDMSIIEKPILYIHIGNGKTGTSAIQKALQENFEFLKQHGFFYVGLCFENAQKKLFPWNYHGGSGELMALPDEQANIQITKNLETVIDQEKNQGYPCLIWSNEWLFARPKHSTSAIQSVAEQCQIRIIAYLRRQDHWLISAYKQWGIKHKSYSGPLLSFTQWYENKFGKGQLDYFQVLKLWQKSLPQAQFSIRIYDQCPDVCTDFFNVIGINYNDLPNQVGRVYETPNDWILSYFALFNSLFDQPTRLQELEPLLRRSGLLQRQTPPDIKDFDLPDEDFLTQLLDQYQESNRRLAETFSTPDYAATFDDAPVVAAKPMQIADPHSLIAGLLLMVQHLDKEVSDLRTQVSELRKSVRSSTVQSSSPEIARIQVAESKPPTETPDTRPVRIAIGVRTHTTGTRVLNLAEQKGFGDGYDVFWIADETTGPLDLPGFPKLAHRLDGFSAMGLPTAGPRPLWYYRDYPLYRFLEDAPGYDYYLMLAYNTLIRTGFFQQLGIMLQTVKPDFAACRFSLRKPGWHWWESAHVHFDEVYGALFSLILATPKAIDEMRRTRLKLASTLASGERGIFCEAFAPSALMQAGFHCLDMNELIPNAWSPETFTADKPIWFEEASNLPSEQWVMYPVLEGADYVTKLKDWIKRQAGADNRAITITTSCFGTPLPADLVQKIRFFEN